MSPPISSQTIAHPDAHRELGIGASTATRPQAPTLRRRGAQNAGAEEIELQELPAAARVRPALAAPSPAPSPAPSRPSSPDTFATSSASGQSTPPGRRPENVAPAQAVPAVPLRERLAAYTRHYTRVLSTTYQAARTRLVGLPATPDDDVLMRVSQKWQNEATALEAQLAAAQQKLARARRGVFGRLRGIVPARFVARGATIGAALMLWSAGTMTMLPLIAFATLVLLLWPDAAQELSASLKGRPTKRELREHALEREVYVHQVLVELYRWAARRSEMYAQRVRQQQQVCGAPSLDFDFERHEAKLRRFGASLDHENIKERLITRLWSHLPLALAWTQAVAVGRIVRQLASLMPLALYLSLLDSGDADSDSDSDVRAAREALKAKRPEFLSRAKDRQDVLARISAHTRTLRSDLRTARL